MNPAFVDFEEFSAMGFERIPDVAGPPSELSFEAVAAHREDALPKLVDWLWEDPSAEQLRNDADAFLANTDWLNDYVLFELIQRHVEPDLSWWDWRPELFHRDVHALTEILDRFEAEALQLATVQFILFRQWSALRRYAESKGLRIMGDLPIYVAANSADTWANPELFQTTSEGIPGRVAGVPPDYFAENGQFWGNPLYDWQAMAKNDYRWWADRMHQAAQLFDLVRIDHFRAFSRYWSIPADAETAIAGEWVEGPGEAVFGPIFQSSGDLEIVAEDLGDIDEGVVELRDGLGLPGMRVVQFAFNEDLKNPHRFENHVENSVCYLGTHDNPTTVAWLSEMDEGRRAYVAEKLGCSADADDLTLVTAMVDATFGSISRYALVSAQDLLGLGHEATMNRPGEAEGNWRWRLSGMHQLAEAAGLQRDNLQRHGRI